MDEKNRPTTAQISCMYRECEILFDEMCDEVKAIGNTYQCELLSDIVTSHMLRTEINKYAEVVDRREFSKAIKLILEDKVLPAPIQHNIEKAFVCDLNYALSLVQEEDRRRREQDMVNK